MYFDGTLNLDGAGAGILFISPRGEQLKYVMQLLFKDTNNMTEYEALIHGLRIAASLGIKRLLGYDDSKVVIQQVNKDWDYTQEKMDAYCKEIRKLEAHFYGLEFHHVLWDYNMAADILSKLGEIHSGICGNHTGASTLVGKAFRSGFYWPTALADTRSSSNDAQGASSFQSSNTSRLRPCG